MNRRNFFKNLTVATGAISLTATDKTKSESLLKTDSFIELFYQALKENKEVTLKQQFENKSPIIIPNMKIDFFSISAHPKGYIEYCINLYNHKTLAAVNIAGIIGEGCTAIREYDSNGWIIEND